MHPNSYAIESGNLVYGAAQMDESANFKRCVQPLLSEKALEPP